MNPWQNKVIADMLAASAAAWPDRLALVDGPVVVRYGELFERVKALAGSLAELGIGEGTHVGTYLGESWEHVVAHYACLYLGAILVPLNLAWEAREISYGLKQAEVEYLIAGEAYRERNLLEKMEQAGVALGGDLPGPAIPTLKRIVQLGAGERVDRRTPTLRALLERDAPAPPASTQPIGYIMFTSGSTAFPKGAIIRQDAVLGTSYYLGEAVGYTAEDRYLNTLPLYHCGGLVLGLLGNHQRGVAIHVFEGFQEEAMLEALRTHRCNSMGGFDIVTMRLVNAYLAQGDDLPVTKMLVAPGMGVYDFLTGHGIRAITCYALTEASNVVSLASIEDDYQHRKYANGRPLPGVEVKVADYETGEPVPPGTPGELCFRGWNAMLGYYKLAEPARPVFDAEGFLHTGDYGWLDEGGWLSFRGRYAMMVKTGGENVSQIEVENFLMSECAGVKQAAVVGVPDPQWDEVVVAFVEFANPAAADVEQLRESCRGRLARFKVPKVIFALGPNEWPVTPTGKVRKGDLRQIAESRLRGGANS